MKRSLSWIMLCIALFVTPALAQAQLPSGMSVSCDDGTSFANGVEVRIVQMRSGFNYTATAIGLNGFDPVLAVLDSSAGSGLCNDDAPGAGRYAASLPTTGRVLTSDHSAQVIFSQNSREAFADVSLVVGGYNNQSGEFLLIIEGMAVTSADGAGDVFQVFLTPGMVASEVPLTVYMITRGQSTVDPLFYLADDDLNAITDNDGYEFYCDDAGDSSACYTPFDLTSSTVSIASGNLWTWEKDAALSLTISGLTLGSDPSQNYLRYVMTSYQQQSEGQYLLAFHAGLTENVPSGGLTGGQEQSGA